MNFAQIKSRRSKQGGISFLSAKKTLEALARPDARLMLMHDNSVPSGLSYFVVPGGRVALDVAEKIIKRDDVVSSGDGLFLGHSQTWKFIR